MSLERRRDLPGVHVIILNTVTWPKNRWYKKQKQGWVCLKAEMQRLSLNALQNVKTHFINKTAEAGFVFWGSKHHDCSFNFPLPAKQRWAQTKAAGSPFYLAESF